VASTVTPPAATPAPVPAPDKRQHVGEDQHRAQADGPKAKQDGASRRNTAGSRLMRGRMRAGRQSRQTAPGPLIPDGEHRQRESKHQKTGPRCHQQHQADGAVTVPTTVTAIRQSSLTRSFTYASMPSPTPACDRGNTRWWRWSVQSGATSDVGSAPAGAAATGRRSAWDGLKDRSLGGLRHCRGRCR
jgi:hypothetical protein